MRSLEQAVAEAVNRLRLNTQAEATADREAGRLAGAEYAGDCSKRTLRKLAEEVAGSFGRNNGDAATFVDVANNGHNNGAADLLHKVLDSDADYSCGAFWENTLGEDDADMIGDEQFAIGFVEGMLTVLEASKSVTA